MARLARAPAAPVPSAPRSLRGCWFGAAVFGATLLAYAPVFKAGYIWNDSDYVTAPGLRSAEGLARIWFEFGATEQYYPILHSAFWIQHRLWGDNPFPYHLFNVLLHATAACLLAAVVRRVLEARVGAAASSRVFSAMEGAVPRPARDPELVERAPSAPLAQSGGDGAPPSKERGIRTGTRKGPSVSLRPSDSNGVAWLAAFLFALHPVHVESVAWISEQKNTLSLVFYLAAALLYLRCDARRSPRVYVAATGFFMLALLAKSVTATLPAALLVVAWWQRGRVEWRRDVVPLLPWFALAAVMGLVSAHVERVYIGAQGSEFGLTFLQRGLLAGRIVWFYVGKLLWPADLIFIYPRWEVDPAQAWQWLFSAGVVLALAVLWWRRWRGRGPLAAALFFGGSLVPTLGFFNVYAFRFSFVADHWQYLPSLGFVVLGAAGIAALSERLPGVAGLRRAVPLLLVGALGVLSFRQCRMYADERTLYATTVARNPQAWMAHNNLGNLRREAGELEAARTHFEAALRVRPDLEKAHNNLGNVLRDQRRAPEAMEHYRRALAVKPDYADAHNNLGSLLRAQGQPAEALRHLLRAVQLAPDFADARNNLGMALRDLGRNTDAIRQFEQAIQLQPKMAAAHLNLALSLSLAGRNAEATERFREARRLNPAIPDLGGR